MRHAQLLAGSMVVFTVGCGARTGLLAGDFDPNAGDAAAAMDGGSPADAGEPADAEDDATTAAAGLDGLRWELPCTQKTADPTVCQTLSSASASATMGGPPGALYDVTLRFRGVVEISLYAGGSADGYWQVGGSPPAGSTINVYGLDISSPPQLAFVNQGVSHRLVVAIDYDETVRIAAGAHVTLEADSRDRYELRNLDASGTPIVVPGVSPSPAAFDGQFVQMDVVSVVRQ